MSERGDRSLSMPVLLRRSLLHRRSRTVAELIALTVSAAVATALLTLYGSLDLKLHHQFRAFGANILVTASQQNSGATVPAALPPNAVNIAKQAAGPESLVVPSAFAVAQTQDGTSIVVVGTNLDGARALDSWWQVNHWPQSQNPMPAGNLTPLPVLTGVRTQNIVGPGSFQLSYNEKVMPMIADGTLRTGDAEDSRIYIPLDAFEKWTGLAPTTLEIQAAGSTANIQAVLAQLQQAFPNADVHAIHQLVDAEANVVSRTRSLMFYSLILISLTVAICVLATLTASVLERRHDFAVMKALGATQRQVGLFFLLETIVLALAGLLVGYTLGCGIAYLIGELNFHTSIFPLWRIVPQVAMLNLLVAALAAAIPLRILQQLEPAALLRGD